MRRHSLQRILDHVPDTDLRHSAHDCAVYLVACSRSLIVLFVGHGVPSCTCITAVRRGLAQEHRVRIQLSSSPRPPCAQRTRTIRGQKARGRAGLGPQSGAQTVQGRRAGWHLLPPYVSPAVPSPTQGSAGVLACIVQWALLAALLCPRSQNSCCFCGNTLGYSSSCRKLECSSNCRELPTRFF